MIVVKDLKKNYNGLDVLKGIDLTINKGDVVCLVGPSGCGKSTFLRCLTRLEEPDGGTVMLDGKEITERDIDATRAQMGMVFQHFNLFPHLTVKKNITLAPVRLGRMSQAAADKQAMELLEQAGYTKDADGYYLTLTLDGYRPCHNAAEIIEAVGYEPEHDLDNPADSVFCAHGAGFVVPWDQVRSHMHVDSGWGKTAKTEETVQARPRRMAAYRATLEEDAELLKIFEQTYGPIKRDPLAAFRPVQKRERPDFAAEQWEIAPEYLLVDGYNIIFAWDELNALAKESLDAARRKLMDILCNYQGYQKCVLILVFDAYRVPGSPGAIEQYHNIHVVYTKEAETADMFIERVTHEIGKSRRVRVATSDGMEQVIILGHGALRVSARMFHEEVQNVEKQIRALVQGQA